MIDEKLLLQSRPEALNDKMDMFEQVGGYTYETFKGEVDMDLKDVKKAINELKEELKAYE